MLQTAQLIRSRIMFDPLAEARATGAKLPVIQVPADFWGGLQPVVETVDADPMSALPAADVLIITWTTAETQGLSAVFTSSRDYELSWNRYAHNSQQFIQQVYPATVVSQDSTLKAGDVGFYTVVNFSSKKVVLFKSGLHPAVDGGSLPVIGLMQQIIAEVSPKLVITTGTGGATGDYLQPGDAVITSNARFKLVKPVTYPGFPDITSINPQYSAATNFALNFIDRCNQQVTGLVLQTLRNLASENNYPAIPRTPQIFYNNITGQQGFTVIYDAVSSNGFTMDDVKHTMGLQLLGIYNEMNDAFVAYAISKLPGQKPDWLSIRNMSEPQAPDLSEATQHTWHDMYTKYSLYSTYNSAFACWGVVCGY